MPQYNHLREIYPLDFTFSTNQEIPIDGDTFFNLSEEEKKNIARLIDRQNKLFDENALTNSPLPIPFKKRNRFLKFDSPDKAALNWVYLFNDESKRRNREAATFIFEDKNGEYYAQNSPAWFDLDSFDIPTLNRIAERERNFDKVVGVAHTHGAYDPNYDSENFSNEFDFETGIPYGDIPFANEYNIPLYLGTPNDTFRVFVPGEGEDKLYMGDLK